MNKLVLKEIYLFNSTTHYKDFSAKIYNQKMNSQQIATNLIKTVLTESFFYDQETFSTLPRDGHFHIMRLRSHEGKRSYSRPHAESGYSAEGCREVQGVTPEKV